MTLQQAAANSTHDAAALEKAIQALSGVPGSEGAIELLKAQAAAADNKYGLSEYGKPYEFYDPMLQVPVCVHMKMMYSSCRSGIRALTTRGQRTIENRTRYSCREGEARNPADTQNP